MEETVQKKENLYVRRKAQQELSICPHTGAETHHVHRGLPAGSPGRDEPEHGKWLLCVSKTPRMFFPRKAFLCPQEEACAKEFSGSSCRDSPLSTHLPLPSKVFAQVIFFAKFALAYFCSLFLHCFPLECQSLFFNSIFTYSFNVCPSQVYMVH